MKGGVVDIKLEDRLSEHFKELERDLTSRSASANEGGSESSSNQSQYTANRRAIKMIVFVVWTAREKEIR